MREPRSRTFRSPPLRRSRQSTSSSSNLRHARLSPLPEGSARVLRAVGRACAFVTSVSIERTGPLSHQASRWSAAAKARTRPVSSQGAHHSRAHPGNVEKPSASSSNLEVPASGVGLGLAEDPFTNQERSEDVPVSYPRIARGRCQHRRKTCKRGNSRRADSNPGPLHYEGKTSRDAPPRRGTRIHVRGGNETAHQPKRWTRAPRSCPS
jgi:hypothetical protein